MGPDSGRVAHPYGELIRLAERERELIANRDYDALWELVQMREKLMENIPEVAAEDALTAIRRLLELQRENDALLEQTARTVEVELSRLRTGRAGVRRYASGGDSPRADFTA
jgi:hypothetical protein